MNLDSLPMFAQDKANHYGYGSWVATAAAIVAMCVLVLLWFATQALAVVVLMPLGAGLAAPVGAYAAGRWVESRQHDINRRAIAAGQPAPHEVSVRDTNATALGALPILVSMLVLQVALLVVIAS